MEFAGVFDIEKPRKGERSGKSESIEPSRRTTTKLALNTSARKTDNSLAQAGLAR